MHVRLVNARSPDVHRIGDTWRVCGILFEHSGRRGKGSNSQIWQRFQEELNEELCEVKISCAEPFVNGKSPEVHCIEKHGEYMAYS
ncbi:hypothetical protein KY285_008433 [Solanum tuberosum]|nr:hypothetical protein KY285_008433 [Solanum tuberosum]